MKKSILTLVAIVCATALSNAQDFHAATLFEASGPVKEIKIDSKNPTTRKSAKFTNSGKFTIDGMTYNSEGYPIANASSFGNDITSVNVEYTPEGKIAKSITISTIGKKPFRLETTFIYDDDQLTKKISAYAQGKTFIEEYGDYTTDDHENWLSRSVMWTEYDADMQPISTDTYTETRTIKYY